MSEIITTAIFLSVSLGAVLYYKHRKQKQIESEKREIDIDFIESVIEEAYVREVEGAQIDDPVIDSSLEPLTTTKVRFISFGGYCTIIKHFYILPEDEGLKEESYFGEVIKFEVGLGIDNFPRDAILGNYSASTFHKAYHKFVEHVTRLRSEQLVRDYEAIHAAPDFTSLYSRLSDEERYIAVTVATHLKLNASQCTDIWVVRDVNETAPSTGELAWKDWQPYGEPSKIGEGYGGYAGHSDWIIVNKALSRDDNQVFTQVVIHEYLHKLGEVHGDSMYNLEVQVTEEIFNLLKTK